MNIYQMKYFLVTAKCLNFSKAADLLYISQPALSKQIKIIEEELGVILFVRNSRHIQLIPPALILQKEFEKIYNDYNIAVAKAQNSYQGLSGTINVGILDGTRVGDLFPGVLKYFSEFFPNVKVDMRNYSFMGLLEKLNSGDLDLIITLKFDVIGRKGIDYRIIEKTRDHVVVHNSHRLSNAKYVKLSDFKDDLFVMVSEEDSVESPKLILDAFKREGVMPKVRFAPSIQAEMLWVQAGVGVCILDTRNIMYDNAEVKFLDVDPISDPSLTLAWNVDNYSPLKQAFIEAFMSDKENIDDRK